MHEITQKDFLSHFDQLSVIKNSSEKKVEKAWFHKLKYCHDIFPSPYVPVQFLSPVVLELYILYIFLYLGHISLDKFIILKYLEESEPPPGEEEHTLYNCLIVYIKKAKK